MNTQVLKAGTSIVPTAPFKPPTKSEHKVLRVANQFGLDLTVSKEIVVIADTYRGRPTQIAKLVAGGMTCREAMHLYELREHVNDDVNRKAGEYTISISQLMKLQDMFPGFVSFDDETETAQELIREIYEEFPRTGLWGFMRAARELEFSTPWDVIEWKRRLGDGSDEETAEE